MLGETDTKQQDDAAARPHAHRLGHPAPLGVYLGAMFGGYAQAVAAAPMAEIFPWHADLARDPDQTTGPVGATEVAEIACRRAGDVLKGIRRWQVHPAHRPAPTEPVVWSEGSSRLLDYGRAGPYGAPVLVVPSLINRGYILDLCEDRSLLRYLADAGLRPFLLDWGAPGPAESTFNLSDYGEHRLSAALEVVARISGARPAVLGYCMGGTLAVGLAARGAPLSCLVTLGAPWRFSGGRGTAADLRRMVRAAGGDAARVYLQTLAQRDGCVPVELFQFLFSLIDPFQAAVKFRKFATADPETDAARRFVLLEDWLADGVAMALPAAEELLVDWQLENAPDAGRWTFMGAKVDPRRVRVPSLIITGRRDTIAPPRMAAPLAERITDADHLSLPMGHVGMITGNAAEERCWRAVVAFLSRCL